MSGPPPMATPSVRMVARRSLLRRSAALGLVLAGGAGLASRGRQPVTSAGGPAGPPRRGGNLRVGMVGVGKNESFNPAQAASALINVAMCCAVFDCLLSITPSGRLRPMLATSWSADAASETWTFQLRQGVRRHDGTDYLADVGGRIERVARESPDGVTNGPCTTPTHRCLRAAATPSSTRTCAEASAEARSSSGTGCTTWAEPTRPTSSRGSTRSRRPAGWTRHASGSPATATGGFMAASLVAATKRFAAAVARSPVTDRVSQHYTSNIPGFDRMCLTGHPLDPQLIYQDEGHGVRGSAAVVDQCARMIGLLDEHLAAGGAQRC